LIATVTFGTILLEAFFIRKVAFSVDHHLDTSNFIKRPAKATFLGILGNGMKTIWHNVMSNLTAPVATSRDGLTNPANEQTPLKTTETSFSGHSSVSSIQGKIDFVHMCDRISNETVAHLDIRRLSRTLPNGRILFHQVSLKLVNGDIVAVRGPSGIGKSQLLRLVAGLVSDRSNHGQVLLQGRHMTSFPMIEWRRQVRYVSQYKIEIPGTPTDFLKTFLQFGAWQKKHGGELSLMELVSSTTALIHEWGLSATAMDTEWKHLSGGESQRVFLAIAIASQPQVLLMDECTSALDNATKLKVEESIMQIANQRSLAVLMITHDEGQMERMTKTSSY
jgi:ABC-type iron transport system FetAB ATPase subunit